MLALSSPALAQVPPATPQVQTQTAMIVSPVSFVFNADTKAEGAIAVTGAPPYDAQRGYGFVSIPGDNESAFSLKLPPGDYRVDLVLGNARKASRTSLWAEDRRLLAAPVVLKAGETRTVSVVVNIRNAALAVAEQDASKTPQVGLRGDEAIGRTWDDQLTISASGAAPALDRLTVTPVISRRILIAGDSTVTDQAGGDYASWGQMLPRFLGSGVVVANHARSGETLKSFLTTLRWDKLMSETRPGDVVLIQFAHNDEKKQWPRTYAAADGAYPAYLGALVADVRQHGASPVLVTPVARRTFKGTKIENSHQGYDAAVRDVGRRLDVPVIDLTDQTTRLYEALGPDLAPLAFAHQGQEKTHHGAYGAWMIACFVARDLGAISALDIKPAAALPACDPDHPVDPHRYEIEPGDWPVMRAEGLVTQTAEPVPVH